MSLERAGFQRIIFVNGHGGNSPAEALVQEWCAEHPVMQVKFHNWWRAPKTWAQVQTTDENASHASWLENFPWTRLPGVSTPTEPKPMVNTQRLSLSPPDDARVLLEDGSFGGAYEKPDEVMRALWRVGGEETRALLEGLWR